MLEGDIAGLEAAIQGAISAALDGACEQLSLEKPLPEDGTVGQEAQEEAIGDETLTLETSEDEANAGTGNNNNADESSVNSSEDSDNSGNSELSELRNKIGRVSDQVAILSG